jgi:hypothetical protein
MAAQTDAKVAMLLSEALRANLEGNRDRVDILIREAKEALVAQQELTADDG